MGKAALYERMDGRDFEIEFFSSADDVSSPLVAQEISDVWSYYRQRATRLNADSVRIVVLGAPGSRLDATPSERCQGETFGVMRCEQILEEGHLPPRAIRHLCSTDPSANSWSPCE